MPGFAINDIGGYSADAPTNVVEPRRKHRWVFQTIISSNFNVPANILLVLKEASRPNFTFDEPDMHHNQEQVYFAGKHKWDPCKMVWYDIEQDRDSSKKMWEWVQSVCQFAGNLPVFLPSEYKGNANLSMIDGRGETNEEWDMYGTWPQNVNWQSLDYSTSDLCQIEVNMRFDRAMKMS
jgi:hypothetical protein